MKRLENKVVLITGAGKGIGRAAAGLFAAEGAKVVIAELSRELGEKAERDILAEGGTVRFVPTDVTDEDSVRNAVAQTVALYGRLDVLYNNAGLSTSRDGPVTECSTEEFWNTLRLNLFGTWLCCRHGIPQIIKAGGGAVVNMASIAGLMGMLRIDAYTAAKGGVIALTRSMATEFAPHKVRVNAIAPTTTLTERVIELNKNRDLGNKTRNLLGPCDPLDIAQAALYLASDESRRVTGHILPVDSGLTSS